MRNRRINRWVLGITLLVMLPIAVLALVVLFGAIAAVLDGGGSGRDFAAIAMLALPVLMMVWGVSLFVRLGSGYQAKVRWALLAFYLVKLACWTGLLVSSTLTRDGVGERAMFSLQEQLWAICLAVIPPIVVLVTKPETRDESVTWRL